MHGANITVKEADEKKNGSGKGSAGKKSGPPTGSGGTSKVRPFAEKDEEENRSYMGYFPAFYHKKNAFSFAGTSTRSSLSIAPAA